MARVTVEDCVDKVPNRFDLVLLAAQRAREISGGASLTVDRDRDKNPVVALREIAEETVLPKILKESVITSLQRVLPDDDDDVDEIGSLSQKADDPEKVSSICAVLAETDVINMVSRGISTPDILKGIHLSIAGRLARLLRAVKAEGAVMVTGGLACDEGLLLALRESIDALGKGAALEVRAVPDGIYAGALGAALLGAWRWDTLARQGRWDVLSAHAA